MTGFIDATTATISGVFPSANIPADSVATSTATSAGTAASTATSKADSAAGGVSSASSTATSAGTQASTADSKATSGVTATSVADSKALSVSVLTSTADSKAVSNASRASIADSQAVSVSILTSMADSKGVSAGTAASVADSKAVSAAAAGGGSSDLVYVGTSADTAINSVSDITIVTRDVTSVGTTDKLDVTADFTILNNSGATRVCVITLDFDGLFDVEFTTGALATSSTLMHPFTVRGVLDIRATNLAYATFVAEGQLAAGIASGTDTTMAATHLRAQGWGTSTSNASGTCTVTLRIRSANATATQTCRLHNFQIRKATPT